MGRELLAKLRLFKYDENILLRSMQINFMVLVVEVNGVLFMVNYQI